MPIELTFPILMKEGPGEETVKIGNPQAMDPAIHRILYMRTDRIGDVLMNLPAIRLLRQTFPKAWITVMLDESVADLLKGHPDLDEILPVRSGEIKKSHRYRAALVKKLRTARFDLGVASNPDKFLHAILFFSRIPRRVGYDRKWPLFLTDKAPADKAGDNGPHEIDKNLRLVSLVTNQSWDGVLSLSADPVAKKFIEDRIDREHPGPVRIIAVHPGTSNPDKRWSEACFAELCDKIQSDQSLGVVLIGGPEEAASSKSVANKMKNRVADWTGSLNLKQLAALFHHPKVKLIVSADSGPAHIAWIAGTPAVILYAKNTTGSDPRRWGPRDKKSEVIYKPMSEITVEEVYAAARKVLQLR